jgi:hypothetical protein
MAKSSKPKEIVVVGSKIKEVIKEAGLRCKGNNRSTVRPYDL